MGGGFAGERLTSGLGNRWLAGARKSVSAGFVWLRSNGKVSMGAENASGEEDGGGESGGGSSARREIG